MKSPGPFFLAHFARRSRLTLAALGVALVAVVISSWSGCDAGGMLVAQQKGTLTGTGGAAGGGGNGGNGGTTGGGGQACGPDQKLCGGVCVSLDHPELGCGAPTCDPCGVPHAKPVCDKGVCGIGDCDPGFADCDGKVPDGCEIDTKNDPQNCGMCGADCVVPNAAPACVGGVCKVGPCDAPFLDCNGVVADGCEANPQVDPQNCGGCNKPCAQGETCQGGVCVLICPPGKADCNNDPSDGCETTLGTKTDCAMCGDSCTLPNATGDCIAGICGITGCDPGFADCNMVAADGCEANTDSSAATCGSCDPCVSGPHSTAVCNGGVCSLNCTAGFADCNMMAADGCEVDIVTGTDCGGCGIACAPADQCHVIGACNPVTQTCAYPNKANGLACNDANPCTQTDACQNGVCVGQNPVACAPMDQCHLPGVCDPATGACSNPVKPNGAACNDGNACTQTDTCQNGVCVGANPVACAAMDQCHDAGVCNPATGVCSNPNKANGAACNDGNACTQNDTCQNGVCVGQNPVACAAADACHDAGVCNPATGVCSSPVKPNGTACNDGNACTQTDTCQNGACVGQNPVACAAMDQCHDAGVCNPATGACSNPNKPNGTACDDSNGCTNADACQAGNCVGQNLPAGTVCRASTGLCDPAETCAGNGSACPADSLAPAGTVCRASAGACDVAETCTGASNACPADTLKPAGTVCRAAAGACDVAELRDGARRHAPPMASCRRGPRAGQRPARATWPRVAPGAGAACPADTKVAAGRCAARRRACATSPRAATA
ncbi:MAG: hypothetical protein U0359_31435 [Byssovorax sp.]